MVKAIHIKLDNKSIDNAIKDLRAYASWVEKKAKELREELAKFGVNAASVRFGGAIYDGVKDVSVRWDDNGSVATIYAEGESVLFIEFGSGAKYGYGHPQADQFGYGPGTWSDGDAGKGHWDDPNGWYYAHGEKSYGNPPAQAMYKTVEELTTQLTRIAREVFSRD